MNCEDFSPIASNVVPCCCVCSQRQECTKKTAQGATNTQDGEMGREINELNYPDASLSEGEEVRQG